ncbi:MAG: CATRA conflict system CASPASE/TPR repeat-associated protein [Actinomycetota bacterium]|nr:CATRA conflict system CASPASE/TPR repeat-associated protein [Actinomycetota bacterium]
MTATTPPGQHLAAHAFVPLDGPAATCAWSEITAFWARCRAELGLVRAAHAGVASRPPVQPPRERWASPIAAVRDAVGHYRLVARRDRNLITVSLRFAARPVGRVRLGVTAGWADYARWWAQLTEGGLDAAIGTCLVFQARTPGAGAESWAGALPAAEGDAPGWWRCPRELGPGAVAFEVTAGPAATHRRMVVLTAAREDGQPDDLGYGPLDRSLANAARLRHEARLHGLSAGLVREVRESAGKVAGWRLAEARWQLVDRALGIALEAVQTSDSLTLGSAVGELELLGPVRPGRVGGSPVLPCPPPVHARIRRLSVALDTGDR